jgi:PKD repeat protein
MHWFSEIEKQDMPKAEFVAPNQIYLNQSATFSSISTGEGLNFFWDFNGDGITDAIGPSASYSFSQAELYTIRLVVSNCAGSDTVYKTIVINFPKSAPIVDFDVSETKIAINDLVKITEHSTEGPYKWEWIITRTDGSRLVSFYNSTEYSQNPVIFFTDTGHYNITLAATNDLGTSYRSRPKYFTVYGYCNPEVNHTITDLGISRVVLSNAAFIPLLSYSHSGIAEYIHPQTEKVPYLAQNGTFYLRISRNGNYNPQNCKVWVDFNGDGNFENAGEQIFSQDNLKDSFVEVKLRIPSSVTEGVGRIRIGTDHNLYNIEPCGPSQAGTYWDLTVLLGRDTIRPEITLKGKDTVLLEEQGFYFDPGFKATDDIDGEITKSVIVTSGINAFVPGIYSFQYNVTDRSGNSALTKERWVKIIPDTTKPVLVLKGPKTLYNEVNSAIIEPGVFFADNINNNLEVHDSGYVDSTKAGFYTRYYIATDARGNISRITRNYVIGDTTDPVLTLIGPRIDAIQVFNSFHDSGVVATDNYSKELKVNVSGHIDTATIGVYKLTYSTTDSFGNGPVQINRYIIVFDTVAPVLTMKQDTIIWDVNKPFEFPNYQLTDNYWNGVYLQIHEIGFVNIYRTGIYKAQFYATDGSNNKSKSYNIYVKVVDRVNPFISLVGKPEVHVNRWADFIDPGIQYGDNFDKNPQYYEGGTFKGTQLPGLFYKIYWVQDESGNKSDYVYRFIYVDDVTTMNENFTINKIKIYPNPASDVVEVETFSPMQEGIITLEDITGRIIFKEGLKGRNTLQIIVSQYPQGIYLVRIIQGTNIFTHKLIIAK